MRSPSRFQPVRYPRQNSFYSYIGRSRVTLTNNLDPDQATQMRRPINAQTLCYQRGSFYIKVRRRQSLYPQLSYPKHLSDLHMYMTAFFLHTLQTATSMRSAETDPDLFCMFIFEKVDHTRYRPLFPTIAANNVDQGKTVRGKVTPWLTSFVFVGKCRH